MRRLARGSAGAAALGAVALLAGAAEAQLAPGNSKSPIDVTADRLEMVDSQHLAIWRGNVEAVQDGSRLVADVLNVYYQSTTGPDAKAPAKPAAPKPVAPGSTASIGQSWGDLRQLVADGHVFFVSTNQTARGNHAVYEAEPDTITMTGDVVVVQGDNVVKGDKAIIQVKTGHADIVSNVTGRNKPDRVRGVFYNANKPADGQPAPAAAGPAKP